MTKIVKNHILALIVVLFFALTPKLNGQAKEEGEKEYKTTRLFQTETPLTIALKYSDNKMRKETNDSTYFTTDLAYLQPNNQWDSLEVRLAARGNWRKEHCFLTPIKMRIKKSERKKNEFKGNKELKLVLPCRNSDKGQDYVLKEYLAYKIYEVLTPYHFNTRLLSIDYTDDRKRHDKEYELMGFMIEDIEEVAKRNDAKRLKRKVHPLEQDDYTSIQNDFFQYMIANTDFSSSHQHNEKLIYDKEVGIIPVPYDFDMSGLVDADYAVVAQIQGEDLGITDVRQRLYRGYARDPETYEAVRQHFLNNKDSIMTVVDSFEPDFINNNDFEATRDYILEFFDILENEKAYQKDIITMVRKR